jgi:Ca-activated chloride channel family protein
MFETVIDFFKNALSDFGFRYPWVFSLVILLFAGFFFASRIKASIQSRLLMLGVSNLNSRIETGLWSLLLAGGLIWLGAMGPRWGYRLVEPPSKGGDLMIVVDVSRSMDVRDVSPSRLSRAKQVIQDFLNMSSYGRVGLVAFAQGSFVQCPLTSDLNAVKMFLSVLDTNLIPSQGTNLANAVTTAVESLKLASEGQDKTKSIWLISDGEDQGGSQEDVQKILRSNRVTLHGLSLGTSTGGPIPEPNGSFKKNEAGEIVFSRANPAFILKLTEAFGGVYLDSSWSISRLDTSLKELAKKGGLKTTTTYQTQAKHFLDHPHLYVM